jgi:hypothetical protein
MVPTSIPAPPAGIDFSIWELQEPSGSGTSPTTISSSKLLKGYSDAYFYLASDGGQDYMDTATGITTANSLHPRSEMRQTSPSDWKPTGTSSMTVTGKVVQIGGGSAGHVCLGQVFDGSTSKPLGEFQWNAADSTFRLLLENNHLGSLAVPPVAASFYILGTASLGSTYTFQLSMVNGQLVVAVNGMKATFTPDSSFTGDSFYFKCGNYDQTAVAGSVTTTPYTIVENYAVKVLLNQ